MSDPLRAVFDCNIYLQAMLSAAGPAAACFAAVHRGSVRIVTSPAVLAEVRRLPAHPDLSRFRSLSPERVDAFLAHLLLDADVVTEVPSRYVLERDPDDSHYIDLALAAHARLVVSRDNDLLHLSDPARPESRSFASRFPDVRVVTPGQLLVLLDG